MAYTKVVPERLPTNLWQFMSADGSSEDDLVKITFENGDVLYVRMMQTETRDKRWTVDPKLTPATLQAEAGTRRCYPVKDEDILGRRSGYVGTRLKISLPSPHWKTSVWFWSESRIASIRPVRRPRNPKDPVLRGTVGGFTSSDYH